MVVVGLLARMYTAYSTSIGTMPERHRGEMAGQPRNELGKRLEAIRADMGLSQTQFARELKTKQQTYSAQIMRDQPSVWFASNAKDRFGLEVEATRTEDREERIAVRAAEEVFSRLEWARLIAYRDDCIRQLRAAYNVPHVSIDLLLADDEEKVREGLIDEERDIRIKQGLPPEGGIFT